MARKLAAYGFPISQQESLRAYILTGRPCGHFLTAILSNNLTHACMRADPVNQPLLFAYGQFLVNDAPFSCWGSPEHVEQWTAHNGLSGLD